MKIYCRVSGREAAWRKETDGPREGYFATPPGKGHNTKSVAKWFDTLDELAHFLAVNPDWKVYVGDGQINTHIAIAGELRLSDLRKIAGR